MKESGVFDQKVIPYFFVAPQLLLVALFFYWPTLQAILWSVHLERPFGGPSPFVGFENFAVLLHDAVFLRSLVTSVMFTAGTTIASISIALALAVALDRKFPGSAWYGTVLLWPYAVAAPAAGIVISLVLDPRFGAFAVLNQWHADFWNPFTNGPQALLLVVVAFVWLHIPFNLIFLSAGLRAVPASVVDAAKLDGAGLWRQFANIRLPSLRPYLFFILLLDITESFTQSFGVINATTKGGPAEATNVLVYNIYADGFIGLDFSRAAAESVILMAMMIAIAAMQFRWFDRRRGN